MKVSPVVGFVKRRKKLIFPLILIVVTVILVGQGIRFGEFWWTDESRHAMDGVFIMDLLGDLPISDLYDYAEIYYAKLPALGLSWYPPFFAVVEALFFKVFGISEVTARLTVLFFTVLAVIFYYLFLGRIYEELIAFFASLLFITTPIVVFWARAVMLELPVLMFMVLSCYFFYNYFFLGKHNHIYYMTGALVLTLYTKQTGAFILPMLFGFILLRKQYKKLLDLRVIICFFCSILLLLPLLFFNIEFGNVGIKATLGDMHALRGEAGKFSLDHWIRFIKL